MILESLKNSQKFEKRSKVFKFVFSRIFVPLSSDENIKKWEFVYNPKQIYKMSKIGRNRYKYTRNG